MTSPTGFLTRPIDDSNNIMLIAMPAGTLIARIMGIMMAGALITIITPPSPSSPIARERTGYRTDYRTLTPSQENLF
jgi:hypothetical protein